MNSETSLDESPQNLERPPGSAPSVRPTTTGPDRCRPEARVAEVVIPVILGVTVPEDHYYLVHSLIKTRCRKDMTQRGWTFAPFQGRQVEDLIHFDKKRHSPALVIRCPADDLGYVQKIASTDARVGNHLIRFGEPFIRQIEPCPVLTSPLVLVTSDSDTRGVKGTDFGMHVGKRLGAMLGRINFGVEFGPRRAVHIKGSRLFGHSVTIKGLTDKESIRLQIEGIGERRGMGLGAFWREGRR